MSANAQQRITRLATLTAVHRAFHWLHLHQPQLRQWQLEMVRIPAPSFGESDRAAWFLSRFQQLGLSNIHLDKEGNALAELTRKAPPHQAVTCSSKSAVGLASDPVILLSAHLDTVFPGGTFCDPTESGSRIYAPGICDNAAGLTALLGIAAALRYANITPPIPILFAANVGEEGEGNLRGMRHLFEQGPYCNRIAAALVLEGGGTNTVVTRALGSLRLRITVKGPGGHSWANAGAPNPIIILSRILTVIADIDLPSKPLITLNVGQISGGHSINSIPESATALLDLRSTNPDHLHATETAVHKICNSFLATATSQNATTATPEVAVQNIGNRPAAVLPDDSPLLETLRAVDRHLTLRTETHLGSTDANIPLSLGIPAMAIGSGGSGGGIHTLQEWYDPTGRETALRRILLTLLDATQVTAETRSPQ
ncbi:M20/M25/M40 family metallo-hydrolase [Edaphobacter paludis]|uniref:M20/M25/M40 family metallo-hydrolase n=1 Tax=Edaphobacter paludis TaxID=3035702 RepID=A0AAU7D228_9BACT